MSETAQRKRQNKSILVVQPGSGRVMLVVGMVLENEDVDLESFLAGLVAEMVRGEVSSGLLVVGDSTLVIRISEEEVKVDEADTTELLGLADLDEPWTRENLLKQLEWWIGIMSHNWRDRAVGRLKELLVPGLVANLQGDVQLTDGIWGFGADRAESPASD